MSVSESCRSLCYGKRGRIHHKTIVESANVDDVGAVIAGDLGLTVLAPDDSSLCGVDVHTADVRDIDSAGLALCEIHHFPSLIDLSEATEARVTLNLWVIVPIRYHLLNITPADHPPLVKDSEQVIYTESKAIVDTKFGFIGCRGGVCVSLMPGVKNRLLVFSRSSRTISQHYLF